MVLNTSIQCQSAAIVSAAVSMDFSHLPSQHAPGTRYTASNTTLIPSSLTSGIMPRINEGNLRPKLSYSEYGNDSDNLTRGVKMEFNSLAERASGIRRHYEEFERSRYGRAWTDEEITLGFVGDVGDLVKLVQAKNGVRAMPDLDQRLAHELADCLWSVFTLADYYHIDLEQAFLRTMDEIEQHLDGQTDTAH